MENESKQTKTGYVDGDSLHDLHLSEATPDVVKLLGTESNEELAPPPLKKLNPEAIVSSIWKGEGSFVEEILQCMTPHVGEDVLNKLKYKIDSHDPSAFDDDYKTVTSPLVYISPLDLGPKHSGKIGPGLKEY
ncbi:hypothetical protein Scep_013146 [Stephania cephalantha]|uniref:ATXR3 C-terminal domain-containing protein n=1 Tax=Stephania cephalantha TaxID=152367 RepID=A0AAP0JGG6_9MAGN